MFRTAARECGAGRDNSEGFGALANRREGPFFMRLFCLIRLRPARQLRHRAGVAADVLSPGLAADGDAELGAKVHVVAARLGDQLGAAGDFKPAMQRADVIVDRVLAEAQAEGDLLLTVAAEN